MNSTQKAIVLPRHGSPDDLELVDNLPVPSPATGDVLIRVRATSLNYHDLFTVRGMPGITIPFPVVPGLDIAGEIAELGDGVTGWSEGDRVLVDPLRDGTQLMGEVLNGGLEEYVVVAASQLISLPEEIDFHTAAALPVAYGTAHRMIVGQGAVHAGDTVLVLGASGGVGTASVKLAQHLGAHVVAAVGSPEKAAALTALGADEVINYRDEDFYAWTKEHLGKPSRFDSSKGFDVVVNNTGGDTWGKTLRSTGLGGRILVCGATAGFDPTEDLRYIWSFELRVIGSNGWHREDLEALIRDVAEEGFSPVIDSVVPLSGAVDALRRLERREIIGKAVIDPTLEG